MHLVCFFALLLDAKYSSQKGSEVPTKLVEVSKNIFYHLGKFVRTCCVLGCQLNTIQHCAQLVTNVIRFLPFFTYRTLEEDSGGERVHLGCSLGYSCHKMWEGHQIIKLCFKVCLIIIISQSNEILNSGFRFGKTLKAWGEQFLYF